MVKGKGQAAKALPALQLPQHLQQIKPQIVEEVWVQCDNPKCKKWRKLPPGVKAPPDNVQWFCSMNPDPYRNSCDIPEEDYSDDDWESKGLKQQQQQQPAVYGAQVKQQQQQHYDYQQQYAPDPAASRRRRSEEYSVNDYEYEYVPKKRSGRRRQAGPREQLPKFFASQQQELQQLQLACQRILEYGGLWDPTAGSASNAALPKVAGASATHQQVASASSISSVCSPGQLAMPVWVWNGLHTYAPDAAAVLVEAIDLVTSCISLGTTNLPQQQQQPLLIHQQQPDATQSSQQQQQLPQQQQDGRSAGNQEQQQAAAAPTRQQQQQPPSGTEASQDASSNLGSQQQQSLQGDKQQLHQSHAQQQQHVSVLEQRWRFVRLALLAAACSTLAATTGGNSASIAVPSVGATQQQHNPQMAGAALSGKLSAQAAASLPPATPVLGAPTAAAVPAGSAPTLPGSALAGLSVMVPGAAQQEQHQQQLLLQHQLPQHPVQQAAAAAATPGAVPQDLAAGVAGVRLGATAPAAAAAAAAMDNSGAEGPNSAAAAAAPLSATVGDADAAPAADGVGIDRSDVQPVRPPGLDLSGTPTKQTQQSQQLGQQEEPQQGQQQQEQTQQQ